jgi:hypothetical protein
VGFDAFARRLGEHAAPTQFIEEGMGHASIDKGTSTNVHRWSALPDSLRADWVNRSG